MEKIMIKSLITLFVFSVMGMQIHCVYLSLNPVHNIFATIGITLINLFFFIFNIANLNRIWRFF